MGDLDRDKFVFIETPDGPKPHTELCGWAGTIRPDLFRESFNMIAAFPRLRIKGSRPITGARSMLWEVGRKVLGKDTPNYAQEIGDCVSFGAKNAIEYVQFYPIANGQANTFKQVFPPYLYGCGRVLIGGGKMGNEDGSLGSWQAQAVMKYGTIPLDADGCPAYSGQVAKSWGYRGAPDNFVTIGKTHIVKSAALVSTWDELCTALVNGYPVTIASDVGFDMKERSDGFFHNSTSWGHQLCATPYTVISYVKSKFIKDIKIGDEVFGDDGKPHYVTEIFKRHYKGKLVVIKGSGTLPLELTPNHPVMVLRDDTENFNETANDKGVLVATKKKKKVWVNASELVKGDLLVCPRPQLPNDSPIIPKWINSPRTTMPDLFVCDELAWLFGLYIADGNAVKNHKIEIKLAIHEKEEAKRAVEAIKLLGLKPSIKLHEAYIHIRAYSSTLANSFSEWFGKQTNKHIPDWLFTWNIEEVVSGIYAGDGNCPTGRPDGRRIVNTSRVLIDQIRTILLNDGQKPSIGQHKYSGKNSHWNVRYSIEWYPSAEKIHTNYWKNNDYIMKVRYIEEKDYDGDVYNFEVEGTHSYIAEGVVIHNCCVGMDNAYKEPHACILNSWGENAHGIITDFTTNEKWPGGTLRVRKADVEKMLSQGDSFAYSSFDGFPAQELPRDEFNFF
jgi:intein/homing endonuclease